MAKTINEESRKYDIIEDQLREALDCLDLEDDIIEKIILLVDSVAIMNYIKGMSISDDDTLDYVTDALVKFAKLKKKTNKIFK